MALERELGTFHRELPRLLGEGHEGKFVLIHGDQVAGIWPSREAALQEGYDRFGIEPFLAKAIVEHETPLYCSHNVTRCRS